MGKTSCCSVHGEREREREIEGENEEGRTASQSDRLTHADTHMHSHKTDQSEGWSCRGPNHV